MEVFFRINKFKLFWLEFNRKMHLLSRKDSYICHIEEGFI